MGIFDKLIGKKGKETQKTEQPQPQTVPTNQNVSETKSSVSGEFDYRNLFCHSLRLNVTAQKMGLSSEDFNKLFENGNLNEQKDENGNNTIIGNVKGFDIVIVFKDRTITAAIRDNSDDLKAHQVTLTFDSATYLETQRLIQDIVPKGNGRFQSINQTLIERDPKRIEKVKFTHKRLRTREECQAVEASMDDVYRQTPEGNRILKEMEYNMRTAEEFGFDPSRTHQFYPSYSKNTVLIKQFDISQISGDISTLECLYGVDDKEVSSLAESLELSLEAKSARLNQRIMQSPKCVQYLRNLQYPHTEFGLGDLTKDHEIIADYLSIVRTDYAKDRAEADKQNQAADIYDSNGTLVSIYTENGEPINRSTITRMIDKKVAQDKFYEEQARKRESERDTKSTFDHDECDFG